MRNLRRPLLSLALMSGFMVACQQAPAPEPQPQAGPSIENPTLNLRLLTVPVPFSVSSNEGSSLVLDLDELSGSGSIAFFAGPIQSSGILLIEEVEKRKAAFQAAEGGTFHGQLEIAGPHGPAYTARGSYDEGGSRIEETWIYSIHPAEYRLLSLRYTYPPGEDTQQRMEQVMEVFGEVETIAGEAVAPPEG